MLVFLSYSFIYRFFFFWFSFHPTDCTRQNFLESKLYDANFDTTALEESYPGGRQIRVGCKVGYTGFFKIICTQGEWISKGTKCQRK